jgi:mannitol-1-phosphate/altronate dehydrogenase
VHDVLSREEKAFVHDVLSQEEKAFVHDVLSREEKAFVHDVLSREEKAFVHDVLSREEKAFVHQCRSVSGDPTRRCGRRVSDGFHLVVSVANRTALVRAAFVHEHPLHAPRPNMNSVAALSSR